MCNNCQLLWDSLVVALAAVSFTFVGFSVGHSNGQKWSTDCDQSQSVDHWWSRCYAPVSCIPVANSYPFLICCMSRALRCCLPFDFRMFCDCTLIIMLITTWLPDTQTSEWVIIKQTAWPSIQNRWWSVILWHKALLSLVCYALLFIDQCSVNNNIILTDLVTYDICSMWLYHYISLVFDWRVNA